MNDTAMKLAEEAIRIGSTLLAQRDALAAKVAELEASVLYWSKAAQAAEAKLAAAVKGVDK